MLADNALAVVPQFDLCGGHLALDFINTLEGRMRSEPNDRLDSYGALLEFFRQTDALRGEDVGRLGILADARASDAERVLERVRALREAMYGLVSAYLDDRATEAVDRGGFNGELQNAFGKSGIVPTSDGFDWDWTGGDHLDQPLWPIVRSAADLLTSESLRDVKRCAADTCAWFFLDTSKNKSRRWCDMKVCGNRAKARAFQARARVGRGN